MKKISVTQIIGVILISIAAIMACTSGVLAFTDMCEIGCYISVSAFAPCIIGCLLLSI